MLSKPAPKHAQTEQNGQFHHGGHSKENHRRRPIHDTPYQQHDSKRWRMDAKEQTEAGWREAVQARFPGMHKSIVFVPPVYFNRLTTEERVIDGEKVKLQIPAKQLSDVRENESHNRMHFILRRVLEGREKGVCAVWGLDFDTYLNNLTGTDEAKDSSFGQATGGSHTNPNGHSSKDTGGRPQHKSSHGGSSLGFKRPRDLESKFQRGTFDMLIISKKHGLLVGEIKATGDAFQMSKGGMDRNEEINIIISKINKAIAQLVKARHVLKILVSDLDSSLPVQTTLMLPNMKRAKLEEALRHDQALQRDFCKSLGRDGNLQAALNCCVFADQLPPMGRAWEMSEDDMEKFYRDWWCNLVQSPGQSKLTDSRYETLVARFCGPATPLHVVTPLNPRAEVLTLHDAVVETGRCLKTWILSKEQEKLQDSSERLVYLTGPQGTGKTVVLMMRALKWARAGHKVIFASLWHGSHAVTYSIHTQVQDRLSGDLKKNVERVLCKASKPDDIIKELLKPLSENTDDTQMTPAGEDDLQKEQEEVEMETDDQHSEKKFHSADVQSPVNSGKSLGPLSGQKNTFSTSEKEYRVPGGHNHVTTRHTPKESLHIIFDEAPWFFSDIFQLLVEKAKDAYGEIHCWTASPFYGSRPASFAEVKLTNTLRCPPVVIRELEIGAAHCTRAIYQYSSPDSGLLSSLPPLTDGPPVKRISHGSHKDKGKDVWDCEECGQEVGRFLMHELKIGQQRHTPDREVLKWGEVTISGYVTLTGESGFLDGLKGEGIPYSIIPRDDDLSYVKALACPDEEKVQIADVESILGLKRTVVVVIGTQDIGATYPRYVDPWWDVISRCNSQLVVVGDMHRTRTIEEYFHAAVTIT